MNEETQKTYKVCCADFAIVIYKHLLLHADELCPCSLIKHLVIKPCGEVKVSSTHS